MIKLKREYNSWVATETLEDYALRYAPKSFRRWSEFFIANTALGGISFLALEAIGGSLVISYGFTNAVWAIAVVGGIIFLAGVPICYYASKYNIDMDLLTRGAGFGYIGSTITSLIYVSFTFIFFALEAAIMAQAIELYFHLPLHWGYLLCSLIIIPLVFFGVTLINKLQLWTQPIWFGLMVLPYIFVLVKEPDALTNWFHFAGKSPSGAGFDPLLFGMAATVSFSLIAQLGEQVDYLRFLPDKQPENRKRWWIAMLLAGPGWIILGGGKQIGGAFLASLAVSHGASFGKALEPIQMYLVGYESVFSNPATALTVGTIFVIVSQIKINVTNAYAGSLAWSNFFSRLTHSHPGRVVWLVFNIAIALLLMELGVFATLDKVLGLYSNVAIAWIGAVVADLVVNKPLGISPSYIEFKRAYLYNFNPVGFGAMLIASTVSILAFIGLFGEYPQAFAPFIALGLAFILSPVIAFVTKGKYYIARENVHRQQIQQLSNLECIVCGTEYETEDMAYCPVYDGNICSLCCSLDASCHDRCKDSESQKYEVKRPILELGKKFSQTVFSSKLSPEIGARFIGFLLLFTATAGTLAITIWLFYKQEVLEISEILPKTTAQIQFIFWKLYAALLVGIGVISWFLILTQESYQRASDELDKQNIQLQEEIVERQIIETQLKQQTQELEMTLQELKITQTRLIQTEKMSSLGLLVAGVAHEINNPVNFIHGNLVPVNEYVRDLITLIELYQQELPQPSKEIQRLIIDIDLDFIAKDLPKILTSMSGGTQRIQEIVKSLRNFSRMDEAEYKSVDLHSGIDSTLMILQHKIKVHFDSSEIKIIKNYGNLPLIDCYAGQLNQVFMNIISNAIDALQEENINESKDTDNNLNKNTNQNSNKIITISTDINLEGQVKISITDNGMGISDANVQRIFDPFYTTKPIGKGTGLGLYISYQIITEKHGGSLECISYPGKGTEFIITIPAKINL
jgi:signal transduction histidine kinase/purine-cytosine permease-like protein